MKNYIRIVFLAVLVSFLTRACTIGQKQVTATVRQRQVPLLKGISNNPLARMTLSIPDGRDRVIKSIRADLIGSGVEDIRAVRLYFAAAETTFSVESAMALFGDEQRPSSKIIFIDSQSVRPGERNFLLSIELAKDANLHHKIGATISKVTFDDGTVITPEASQPAIQHRIGVAVRQHGQDGVDTYRIPGLATTNKGTLLATYDVRRNSDRDLQGDIDIGVSRSTDGGATWEPMRLALDMDEQGGLPQKFNGVSDACILVDENSDTIFIAGLWMHGVLDKDGRWIEGLTKESTAWEHQWQRKGSQPGFGLKQTSQFLLAKSTDDGRTWSKPVNLTRQCKKEEWWLWAPAPGSGITLEDGTLVFPTQGRDENGIPFSNITYSKDGGETWRTSNSASSNTTECAVVQLDSGDLMLNIRDNRNRRDDSDSNGRSVFITSDLGQTWTEHPTSRGALIESTCMASLHKHIYTENGQEKSILLFSNPNTKTGRHHTTIKVSFDDGKTWPAQYWLLLDEGHNRGYSCLTSIDEQTIGILYEGSQADMTFESIPLKELIHIK